MSTARPFSLAVTGKQLMCIQQMSCVDSQSVVVAHGFLAPIVINARQQQSPADSEQETVHSLLATQTVAAAPCDLFP